MCDWSFERVEMPDIGVLRYNMFGVETHAITVRNQSLLTNRLQEEAGWSGILFDYTECVVAYTLSEFSERMDFMIKNLPPALRLAYVFGPKSLIASARASKILSSSGINTQAFSNDAEALDFLKGNESWRRAGIA